MVKFDETKEARSPLFKFVRRYMRMVLLIYAFIRATRDGIWELHLASLDELLDRKIDRVDLNDQSPGNSVRLDRPTRLWGILSTHLDSGQR